MLYVGSVRGYEYVSVGVTADEKEDIRSPRAGVTGSCEPPDVHVGAKLGSSEKAVCALNTGELSHLPNPK